ncbi:MAG: DUF1302 family protein, partial [bacterium]
ALVERPAARREALVERMGQLGALALKLSIVAALVGTWGIISALRFGTWSRPRLHRRPLPTTLVAISLLALLSTPAGATIRVGPIQISGNLDSQNLVRVYGTLSELRPVQQRNTFRLQYEHVLLENGALLGGIARLPFVDKLNFFAYYRFAYDTIYDIAPGGVLREQSGGPMVRIPDFRGGRRYALAHESELREVFLDAKKGNLSFRIGRQQIVWGNTLTPGVLDNNHTIDAGWHGNQEKGLLGRVGYSEVRNPLWAFKVLYNLGSIGPFTGTYFEAYDAPFAFFPTNTKAPAIWSLPFRDPFRAGQVIDLGRADGAGGLPEGNPLLQFQTCYDFTSNTEPNGGANTPTSGNDDIFANTATTGLCPSRNLPVSRRVEGLFDRTDPFDTNQVGARIGTSLSQIGLGITLNYIYRRGGGAEIIYMLPTKTHIGALNANPENFIEVRTHETTDPATRETHAVQGYVRIPIEFYYPYVHIFGPSFDYFDEFTETVYNLELAYTRGVRVGNVDPTGNLLKKKDTVSMQLLLDRQIWIRPLHRRSTFTTLFQTTVFWLRDHEDLEIDPETRLPVRGDVGPQTSKTVEGQHGQETRIDRLKEFEIYSIFAITTFYRGGTIAPLLGVVADWANAPSFEFVFLCDVYLTNNFVIQPQVAAFTNFGRTVDEPWGIGRYSQHDEFGVKLTYQF